VPSGGVDTPGPDGAPVAGGAAPPPEEHAAVRTPTTRIPASDRPEARRTFMARETTR